MLEFVCVYRAKLKRIKFGNDIVRCHIEHRLFVGWLVLNYAQEELLHLHIIICQLSIYVYYE